MKNIEVYNTLNIDKDSSSIVATFTQEDDAVMEFKLFKDGQEIVLKDQTISLGAERKDGAVIEQEDGFLIKENNVLNITLKKNIIQVVGVVKIQLYLKDKSGEMASNTFNIRVNKKLLGAENVEATNDIKSLNTLVLELKNNTNKLIDDTKAKADKLLNGLQETGDNLSSTVKAKTDKIIEDTKAEVNNIKKDYEGLKKVVIDENIGIKLQKDVTELQNGLKSNQSLSYEGSSINANDTLEGRTEGMKIGGRTLQNLIKDGKGTFVIDKSKSAKRIYEFSPVYNLEKGKKYKGYIFINNVENTAYGISIYGLGIGNAGAYGKIGKNTGIVKFTWNTSQSDVDSFNKVGIYIENTDFENGGKATFSNLMLFEEETDLTYIDEYFEGIKSFGEAEQEGDKYKISILSCGKNILKPLKNYSTINGFNLNNILKNGVQYTVTNTKNQLIKIAEFKDADTFLGQSTNGKFTFTFDNSKQQKLYIWKKYDSQVAELFTNEDIDFVMIEEGTGTIFEPYKEDKKDILIKEPLRSIGDFSDVMYEDNGQVKITRNIVTYTFTGDEKFSLIASDSQGNYISFLYTSLNNRKYQTKLISNNFVKLSSSQENKEGIYCYSSNFNISIRVLKSKLNTQDVEGFKAWLKANPTTIVYQLSTPVTEIVENCVDIDLDTFQDKTYFNILNSMPGILDFKIPSNLASIVQSHTKDIKILYDLIDRLLIPNLIENKSDLALLSLK